MYYQLVYKVTVCGETYEDEVEVQARSLADARRQAVECWPGAKLELVSSSTSYRPKTRQGKFSRLLLGWR